MTSRTHIHTQPAPPGRAYPANLYASWRIQQAGILCRIGLQSVRQLRGRPDLLVVLE